jgi:class 3 adenylate cyclase/tetratricopeptide (TPR) repeat protein
MKEHKLAAIVFTDIVGYTSRMEADEESTMNLLSRQREIIFPVVKEFGGDVIKEIGDGMLIMFTSANKAVRFAMAVQERLKDDELTIRAGIHIGDVVFEDRDVFGSAVNIAARIEPLAPAGGICISEDVRNQIRNQKDILTASIGKKELKGVDGAMEIFKIVSERIVTEEERIPFIKDLWQRRVVQVTFVYLLLSYLVKFGVGFFVKEYFLSPHLTDLVWYILLSLIPSIILLSYFHGKKGMNKWTKTELIGMPVNVVAAVLVMVFVFEGKDLGAITTTLKLQNEEGEQVEKLVLKNEYRKRVIIFNLENTSEDTNLRSLRYSIPEMTKFDLSQDLFFTIQSAGDIYSDIASAGYVDGTGLPVTLMKKFADEQHMNYFIAGDLNKEGSEYVVNARVYDTKLTRQISEITVMDESPFDLADKLSVEIKEAVGLPESHISETADLPIKEIFTASESALYYFTRASIANALNDWEGNVRFLNLAIEEDPLFALAYVQLTLSYFNIGDLDGTRRSMQQARELMHKLTERQQFVIKYVYYVIDQQPEKALAVARMWAELYPDDIMAHFTLASRYGLRNMFNEAIDEFKEILRLDPEQYEVMSTLGDYYLHLGQYDSSLFYYEKYASNLPQQTQPYRKLGSYFLTTGDIEKAKENYERALLLSDVSEEVPIKRDLASVLLFSGNFTESLEQYRQALAVARNARDSASVLSGLEMYYKIRGQVRKSLDYFEQRMLKYATFLPPKDALAVKILNIEPYVIANESDRAISMLDIISEELKPPLDNLINFGYLYVHAETGDIEKAREAIGGAYDLIEGFGQENLLPNVLYSRGRIFEWQEQYDSAIVLYKEYYEMQPTSYFIHEYISRCHRELKEYDKAEEEILKGLKYRPFNPSNNYEAALVYFAMGREEKAMEYLQKAVEIWQDADPGYEKANEAKTLLARHV